MRFLLFIALLISPWGLSYVSAAGGDKAGTSIPHTEHPPHDHHHDDHVKKLDEGLRRSREEKKKEDD